MIRKVLIANRGEIAVRIIRAAREEGIRTVAIYSDADADAVHVRLADEAVHIGPSPAVESYLNMDRIIETAKAAGCEAIHPGYGFLAENAVFARKIEEAGLIFIGPPPAAISAMGDKLEARRIMTDAGVPVVPGELAELGSPDAALEAADRIGYPVLVKAAGGGGGKGMRRVDRREDLPAALEGAAREAGAAFGDKRVYLEKYLVKPRHVEIQVFADNQGKTLHFFERECSIQRRHQKIIEETPSPALTDALRREMCGAAVKAAEAVGYRSAGTVEFLLDQDGRFYFLEMNTRIQVEHPVTEMVTGYDLVRLQFRIAAGEPLPMAQDDIVQRGHAIECRLYAEDPDNNFLPSPGELLLVKMPEGPGIRVDSGIDTGLEVSTFYDPILAKLVVWGADRREAVDRMVTALKQTVILGIKTPVPLLIDILEHEAFRAGDTFTDFLPEHGFLNGSGTHVPVPDEVLLAAALFRGKRSGGAEEETSGRRTSPWTELGAWRMGD